MNVNMDKGTAGRQESVDSGGISLYLAFCKYFSISVLLNGRGVYSAGENGSSAPGIWWFYLVTAGCRCYCN